MKYQQLTEGKRYQIAALLEQGLPVKNIALTVGCHRGTIYRESAMLSNIKFPLSEWNLSDY